jgi:hypothetical protein
MSPLRVVFVLVALLVLLAVGAQGVWAQGAGAAPEPSEVPLYFFWGDGCPVCATQKEFHVALREAFPNVVVHDYEVYYVPANRPFMEAMAAAFGRSVSGVPMTFIGDEAWVGFSQVIAQQMVASIERYGTYRAPDPIDRLEERFREFLPTPREAPPAGLPLLSNRAQIEVPLVGVIDLSSTNLWLATGLIAFVDGFNPCSLWVLALLLAVVVNTRSRKRVLLVGLTFLTVTAAVYGLFIAGLFTVFSYIGFLGWIRVLVALLALGFAAINIKDYFAYRRGITLSIDDAHKPGIYARIRKIMQAEASLPATLFATAGMALGVTLVELPCTAGLPVLWTTLLADAGVVAGVFGVLLLVYMLIYLLDELLIFGLVVGTMRAARLEERGGRVLKLIGGAVMLALALVMLFSPKLLESIPGTLAVFGGAMGGSLLVVFAHRFVHPASSPWGPPATRG